MTSGLQGIQTVSYVNMMSRSLLTSRELGKKEGIAPVRELVPVRAEEARVVCLFVEGQGLWEITSKDAGVCLLQVGTAAAGPPVSCQAAWEATSEPM